MRQIKLFPIVCLVWFAGSISTSPNSFHSLYVPRPLISVGPCRLGGPEPLYILGPCVIESEEFVWRMARQLKTIAAEAGVQFVFKASYDKANRTSVKSFRGLDARAGCRILADIGRELGVPVTTDI